MYGVRLADMYEGRISVTEVADFAAHLPRGSAIFEWYGGPMAVSAEVDEQKRTQYLLHAQLVQASGKKRAVPEPQYPKPLRDAVVRAKQQRNRLAQARADAAQYRRRAG